MSGLEFHVVTQHRGELLGIHLAVVSPGRFIAVRCCGLWFGVWICRAWLRRLALSGSSCGVSAELCIAEALSSRISWRRFSAGRGFRFPEKIALQGQFRLRVSGSRHRPEDRMPDRKGVGRFRPFMV